MATTAAFLGANLARSALMNTNSTGSRFGLWKAEPHSHSIANTFRKMAHGAGAGFLLLSGAGAIQKEETAAALSKFNLTSIEGVIDAALAGAFNDPLQIAGAAFIFLAAGRCVARFFGLAAAFAAFIAYSNGVTLGEFFTLLESAGARIGAATAAFMDPSIIQ